MDKKLALSAAAIWVRPFGGLIASGQVQPGQIWVYTRRRTRLQLCATSMASTPPAAPEVAQIADIVFGAVKPGIMTSAGRYRLQPE